MTCHSYCAEAYEDQWGGLSYPFSWLWQYCYMKVILQKLLLSFSQLFHKCFCEFSKQQEKMLTPRKMSTLCKMIHNISIHFLIPPRPFLEQLQVVPTHPPCQNAGITSVSIMTLCHPQYCLLPGWSQIPDTSLWYN